MLKLLLNPAVLRRTRVVKKAENLQRRIVEIADHRIMKVLIRNLVINATGTRKFTGASVILATRVSRVGGSVLGAIIAIGIGSGIIPGTVIVSMIVITAVSGTAPLTMSAIGQSLAMTAVVIIPQIPLTIGQNGFGLGIDVVEHQC